MVTSDRKQILFLQKRLLFPTDSGGKIRTLNVLRHLAKWHDITYLCNILPHEQPYLPEMQKLGLEMITIPWTEASRESRKFYRDLAINLFSRFPFNVNKDFDPRLRERAQRLLQERSYDLLICDFVQMARNCVGFNSVPKLLFEHNVESQIFQRHAQTDGSLARRTYMWLQWKKMHRFEGQAGRDFNGVVAVSDADRRMFEREYGWKHVKVIDTAVDTEYFVPTPEKEQDHCCVFVASMDWLPNEDGVKYFVREIWPRVRAEFPGAVFRVVGRNPSSSLRSLGNADGIEITGTVADIRPHLSEAQVVVIPLLVGGGTRLKAYEAMAMGKPIVSTSLGVEGLDVKNGENVLIADSPAEFASQIVRLYRDPQLRTKLSQNAIAMVNERYTAERVAEAFNAICQGVMNKRV